MTRGAAPPVVVLDRDQFAGEPAPRPSTPQARHSHGVLAGGREAMEELLPGLTEELVGQGAGLADIQERASSMMRPNLVARVARSRLRSWVSPLAARVGATR